MTTTFDGLRDIIVRDFELAPDRLCRDTPLEEIELDSLAIAELVFTLEDEFHVMAGNVNPSFKNLGDIADYIDQLIAERDAAPKATRAASPKATGAAAPKIAPAAAAKTSRSRAKSAGAARGSAAKTARPARGDAKACTPKRAATNGAHRGNGAKRRAAHGATSDATPSKRNDKRASATPNSARTR